MEAILSIINFTGMLQSGREQRHKEEQERILREWNKALKLPRKAKKRRKRELILDFSINEWTLKNGF